MSLALFDLDNTLLADDSDYLWGRFLVEQGLVDGVFYERENQKFYDSYRAGTLDIHAFLHFMLRPLTEHPLATLLAWRAQFTGQPLGMLLHDRQLRLLYLQPGAISLLSASWAKSVLIQVFRNDQIDPLTRSPTLDYPDAHRANLARPLHPQPEAGLSRWPPLNASPVKFRSSASASAIRASAKPSAATSSAPVRSCTARLPPFTIRARACSPTCPTRLPWCAIIPW
jgi:hypothetical protein